MDPLQQIISAISGETAQANSMAPAPWQQELLETVNPEKVKKQRIAQAIAKASQAMATTPGNFLQGVSAAATTGANDYLMSKEQTDMDRVRAMQAVDLDRQRQRETRLRRLYDQYGLLSGEDDKTYRRDFAEGEQKYRRDRDTIVDADRAEERADRQEDRKLRREGRDLTSKQYANEQAKSRRAAADAYLEWEQADGLDADEATKQSKWSDLLDRYGVTESAAQPSPSPAPGFQEGATATNPQTGERVILRNGKWQPL